MPILNIPEHIEVEYDTISNEQRAALKLIMDGDGLYNPLAKKINECVDILNKEIELVEEISIIVNNITQQEKTDILYLMTSLIIAFEDLKIHTDKITGTSEDTLSEFFQRLSVAGKYTEIMKSITGKDEEKYSFIFASIMGAGDLCLDRISKRLTCPETSTVTVCGNINDSSGILGLAQQIKNRPSIISSVIYCLLPSLLQCIRDLTNEDDYCQARKIVESYSAGSRIAGDIVYDPIYHEVVRQVMGSHQLKQSLLELENERLASDAVVRTTEIFFENFPYPPTPPVDPNNCRGECCDDDFEFEPINYNCNDETLVLVGPTGPSGRDGEWGLRGPAGPAGGTGNCECEPPPPTGVCCVDYQCFETTQQSCTQWNGNYKGDHTVCEFEWCGPCRNNGDCELGKICCDGECVISCCDGLCPPCPPCNCDDSFPCGDEHCCPIGHCCVSCDHTGGGDCVWDSDCPTEQCCENNICRLCPECLENEDCSNGFCCINGFCLACGGFCNVDDDCGIFNGVPYCCENNLCQPCIGNECEHSGECATGICCLESFPGSGINVCKVCPWVEDCLDNNSNCGGPCPPCPECCDDCHTNPDACFDSESCPDVNSCACCFNPIQQTYSCQYGNEDDCQFGSYDPVCEDGAGCDRDSCPAGINSGNHDDCCCFYGQCADCIAHGSCCSTVYINEEPYQYCGCGEATNESHCQGEANCCWDSIRNEYCCGDGSGCNEVWSCCIGASDCDFCSCLNTTYEVCDGLGQWQFGVRCDETLCGCDGNCTNTGCAGSWDCNTSYCCVDSLCEHWTNGNCDDCNNYSASWCGDGACCLENGECCSGTICDCPCILHSDCEDDECCLDGGPSCVNISEGTCPCIFGNGSSCIDGYCCDNELCIESSIPCSCFDNNDCPVEYCCITENCVHESEGLCPCNSTTDHCSEGYCCWYNATTPPGTPRNFGGGGSYTDSCCVENNREICNEWASTNDGNCCIPIGDGPNDFTVWQCRNADGGSLVKNKNCCDVSGGVAICKFECPSLPDVLTPYKPKCNECPDELPSACCLGSGPSTVCEWITKTECNNNGGVWHGDSQPNSCEGIDCASLPDSGWGTCQCCSVIDCDNDYGCQYCSDECSEIGDDDWIVEPACACIRPKGTLPYVNPPDPIGSQSDWFPTIPPHCDKYFDDSFYEEHPEILIGCGCQENQCVGRQTDYVCDFDHLQWLEPWHSGLRWGNIGTEAEPDWACCHYIVPFTYYCVDSNDLDDLSCMEEWEVVYSNSYGCGVSHGENESCDDIVPPLAPPEDDEGENYNPPPRSMRGTNQCCIPQCPGGGCPDCLVGGVLTCCPPGTLCCGNYGCVAPENCCNGSYCNGACCNGTCCNTTGTCCGGGCPCESGNCCDGNCCESSGECCGDSCGCVNNMVCCNGECTSVPVGDCCTVLGGEPCTNGNTVNCCIDDDSCCSHNGQCCDSMGCCPTKCGGGVCISQIQDGQCNSCGQGGFCESCWVGWDTGNWASTAALTHGGACDCYCDGAVSVIGDVSTSHYDYGKKICCKGQTPVACSGRCCSDGSMCHTAPGSEPNGAVNSKCCPSNKPHCCWSSDVFGNQWSCVCCENECCDSTDENTYCPNQPTDACAPCENECIANDGTTTCCGWWQTECCDGACHNVEFPDRDDYEQGSCCVTDIQSDPPTYQWCPYGCCGNPSLSDGSYSCRPNQDNYDGCPCSCGSSCGSGIEPDCNKWCGGVGESCCIGGNCSGCVEECSDADENWMLFESCSPSCKDDLPPCQISGPSSCWNSTNSECCGECEPDCMTKYQQTLGFIPIPGGTIPCYADDSAVCFVCGDSNPACDADCATYYGDCECEHEFSVCPALCCECETTDVQGIYDCVRHNSCGEDIECFGDVSWAGSGDCADCTCHDEGGWCNNTTTCCQANSEWCGKLIGPPCGCDGGNGCTGRCGAGAGPCPGTSSYWHGGCCPCDFNHDGELIDCVAYCDGAGGGCLAECEQNISEGGCMSCTLSCNNALLQVPASGWADISVGVGKDKDIEWNELFEVESVKKIYDNQGRFVKNKADIRKLSLGEVQEKIKGKHTKVIGKDNTIAKDIPLVKPLPPLEIITNIDFDIINFVADNKLKTESRTYERAANETKSKISIAEMVDDGSMSYTVNYESNSSSSTKIKGTLSSVIRSDGIIGKTPIFTFVSGSNIRLDTNEATNIIRISVDDLKLSDVINHSVGQGVGTNDGDIFNFFEENGKIYVRTRANDVDGPVGPEPPIGSNTGGILYNKNNTIGSTTDFVFLGGELGITSEVYFNNGINFHNNCEFDVFSLINGTNNITKPNFNYTTEENCSDDGVFCGITSSFIVVDFGTATNHYGIGTGGNTANSTSKILFFNTGMSGSAKVVTLILRNGGQLEAMIASPGWGQLAEDTVWPGGVEPTLTEDGIDILSFLSVDGGDKIYGFVNGLDVK